MENHISHIEQLGSVHIGTQAILDNRQPLDDSEYGSEFLPALTMDNMKPGVYQHLRFHLNSDDARLDCFVHEEHLGALLSGDNGDVRFLDTLDFPENPAQNIITWHDDEVEDREGEWTSLATLADVNSEDAVYVFVGRNDGLITAIAIDPDEVILYDRYKKDARQVFGNNHTDITIGMPLCEIGDLRESLAFDNLAIQYLDGTTDRDIREHNSERDEAKGFDASTNITIGRLMTEPTDEAPRLRVTFATKYEYGRQGIRNLFAALQQEYDKYVAPTTVDISDLDVETDKQL